MMIDLAPKLIRTYGCTRCQAWHREGEPLYTEHLYWQSKHGVREDRILDHYAWAGQPKPNSTQT